MNAVGCVLRPRLLAGGNYMPDLTPNLFYGGHEWKAIAKTKCPIPGAEDGMVKTTFACQPAWWTDGHLYVAVGQLDLKNAFSWATLKKKRPTLRLKCE